MAKRLYRSHLPARRNISLCITAVGTKDVGSPFALEKTLVAVNQVSRSMALPMNLLDRVAFLHINLAR